MIDRSSRVFCNCFDPEESVNEKWDSPEEREFDDKYVDHQRQDRFRIKSVNPHSLEGLEHLVQAGIDKGMEEIKSFQEKGNHQKNGTDPIVFHPGDRRNLSTHRFKLIQLLKYRNQKNVCLSLFWILISRL